MADAADLLLSWFKPNLTSKNLILVGDISTKKWTSWKKSSIYQTKFEYFILNIQQFLENESHCSSLSNKNSVQTSLQPFSQLWRSYFWPIFTFLETNKCPFLRSFSLKLRSKTQNNTQFLPSSSQNSTTSLNPTNKISKKSTKYLNMWTLGGYTGALPQTPGLQPAVNGRFLLVWLTPRTFSFRDLNLT